ncbi:MAG: D-alanyl-D-alanine carboxypeptidase, partial [Alphaproteobacteria bacterium]
FNNYAMLKAGDVIDEAQVWLGDKPTVALIVVDDLTLTLPKKSRRGMKVKVTYDGPIPAPIRKGDRLATLSVITDGRDPIEIPLIAADDINQLGLLGRLGAAFQYILLGGSI